MTVTGTPMNQSTADRMTHLLDFAEPERLPDVKGSANPSFKADFEFNCWAMKCPVQAQPNAEPWRTKRTNPGTQIWNQNPSQTLLLQWLAIVEHKERLKC